MQKTQEASLVISLKKMIQNMKQELLKKDETIEELKHDSRGTLWREMKIERNAFQDEANRLRAMLDNFVEQIGGVDQVINFRGYIDQQKEYVKQLEDQHATQLSIYEAKQQEWTNLEKKLVGTEIEREQYKSDLEDKNKEYDEKNLEYEDKVKECDERGNFLLNL